MSNRKKIIPFKASHAFLLGEWCRGRGSAIKKLESNGNSFSFSWNGRVIASAGLIPADKMRAVAWTMNEPGLSLAQVSWMIKSINSFLDKNQPSPWRRIEMTTLDGNKKGYKLANILGFLYEGTMAYYDEDGNTHHLCARIRHG